VTEPVKPICTPICDLLRSIGIELCCPSKFPKRQLLRATDQLGGAAQAAAHTLLVGRAAMAHQAAPCVTTVDLPADVLIHLVKHLQQDDWQRGQMLGTVAALRSTSRSLRHAVDVGVMHATFHENAGASDVRSTVHRCPGNNTVVTCLSVIH
jgi:hypothetical protein